MTFIAKHIGCLGGRRRLRERGRESKRKKKENGKHSTKEKPGLSHEWQVT